jgi:hypothetical protein
MAKATMPDGGGRLDSSMGFFIMMDDMRSGMDRI